MFDCAPEPTQVTTIVPAAPGTYAIQITAYHDGDALPGPRDLWTARPLVCAWRIGGGVAEPVLASDARAAFANAVSAVFVPDADGSGFVRNQEGVCSEAAAQEKVLARARRRWLRNIHTKTVGAGDAPSPEPSARQQAEASSEILGGSSAMLAYAA